MKSLLNTILAAGLYLALLVTPDPWRDTVLQIAVATLVAPTSVTSGFEAFAGLPLTTLW